MTDTRPTLTLKKKKIIIIPPKVEPRHSPLVQEKKPKKSARKAASKPKVIKPAPSVEKAKELDTLLKNKCRVWRDYLPITKDGSFEHEVYKLAREHDVFVSKVLLTKLLKQHKRDKRYVQNIAKGGFRLDFFKKTAEPISSAEQSSAAARLLL